MQDNRAPTRRGLLGGGLAAIGVVLLPRLCAASPAQVEAEIAKLYAGRPIGEGKIKLEVPPIAENGLVVPVNFEVLSPMTAHDYVKVVHLFADGNPNPAVASFYFTPSMPKAAAQLRMRLAQTQNVVALAEMSDGSLAAVKKEVKVTIGGCGG
jgi:sulfur-oxidizing protein SoxY